MRPLLLLMALPSLAVSGTLHLRAYDENGRLLDRTAFLKKISPSSKKLGLSLVGENGLPLPGSPWIDEAEKEPVLRWSGGENARISLVWPVAEDGVSSFLLDARGEGYGGEQKVLLNEELALDSYRRFQDSLQKRSSTETGAYAPGSMGKSLAAEAREAIRFATAEQEPRARAARFDRALSAVSRAWQHSLFEHGLFLAKDKKRSASSRWGAGLDESAVDRIKEYDWIAEQLSSAGFNWARVVFKIDPEDPVFERKSSLTLYDELVAALKRRNLSVMGSVLDSMLWPKNPDPEQHARRARNLALHYKDLIRSWETASEPNGSWLGPEETVLLCVMRAAEAVKSVDPTLETTASLHWWDATAPGGKNLWSWLAWALPRGFGNNLDVVGLSIYPHRHPLGIGIDPAFSRLAELFPDKKLLLSGWAYGDKGEVPEYWWMNPDKPEDARDDLAVFFTGSMLSLTKSVGGGFYWNTLNDLIPPGKAIPPFYKTFKTALKKIKKGDTKQ